MKHNELKLQLHVVIRRMSYLSILVGLMLDVSLWIYTIKINGDMSIPICGLLLSVIFYYMIIGFAKIVEAAEKYLKQ